MKSPIGQNPEWTITPIGQNPEWTKFPIGKNPELDKIPNRKNPELDQIPNGQNPKWTKSRMDKFSNQQNPEWKKSRMEPTSKIKSGFILQCIHCWLCTNSYKELIFRQNCMSFICLCRGDLEKQRIIYQNRVIKPKNFAVLSSYLGSKQFVL